MKMYNDSITDKVYNPAVFNIVLKVLSRGYSGLMIREVEFNRH